MTQKRTVENAIQLDAIGADGSPPILVDILVWTLTLLALHPNVERHRMRGCRTSDTVRARGEDA